MRTYRAQKAALTRAVNKGEPEGIMRECKRFVREYRSTDTPFPDDWSRWARAYDDAAMQRGRDSDSGYRWVPLFGY